MSKHKKKPPKGALALDVFVNLPSEPLIYPVRDIAHALQLSDSIADSHLMNDDIASNAFVLNEFDGEEWTEWISPDGKTMDELNHDKPASCKWVAGENEGDIYKTQCDNLHVFIAGDVERNQYKYCPYCGGLITK